MRELTITYNDLSIGSQALLEKEIVADLIELYKKDGEEYMNASWHVAPKNSVEAYCREHAIEYILWNDLDEKSEEFQKFDWKTTLEMYADDQAHKFLAHAFRNVKVQVHLEGEAV
jgi:hypothetical protein